MHTYKAQIRITSVVITTVIQADNIHNAKLLLTKLYGANSVLSVLQVN
jgi:hypothetical protein